MSNFNELSTQLDELKARNVDNLNQADYDKYSADINKLRTKITEFYANPYPERNLPAEIEVLSKTLVGFPEFRVRLEDLKRRSRLKGTQSEQDRYINDLNGLKNEINELLDQKHFDEVKKAEDLKKASEAKIEAARKKSAEVTV